MTAEIQTYSPKVASKFSGIKVGDAVGSVDGPGVFPTDNLSVVLGFGEDRWYEYVVVLRADGRRDKVISFTEVGIGHYHLPTYLYKKGEAA